tara:strand:+ start:468 stop:665 length:198 start_codon:yes stop_codon:yes gene_type:complete
VWNICVGGRYAQAENERRQDKEIRIHGKGQSRLQKGKVETTKEINQGGQWFSTGTTTAETEVAIR